MRFLIQSVQKASVEIQETEKQPAKLEEIGEGILLYFGVATDDLENYEEKIEKFVRKVWTTKMLKWADDNISANLEDLQGGKWWEILVISNFTLFGENNKGTKISFTKSADFTNAEKIYNYLVEKLSENYTIKTWEFWAMMKVSAINDWPINYIRDY